VDNGIEKQKDELFNILSRDIKDIRVLNAMKGIPREEFFPPRIKDLAYLNSPFDIGYGQTISQPYIVALMLENLELKKNDTVLDIGTGSGYQAAILSKLCKKVVSIEIVPELVKISKGIFKRLGYYNIQVIQGNGRDGYMKDSPYDKIVCAAVSSTIPKAWREQLEENGIVVLPMYENGNQVLVKARKVNDEFDIKVLTGVRFVPLVG
jgi:protein-L-isoaspartate(D-aspartate) O-methyltransferase